MASSGVAFVLLDPRIRTLADQVKDIIDHLPVSLRTSSSGSSSVAVFARTIGDLSGVDPGGVVMGSLGKPRSIRVLYYKATSY